jgi:hypothetical protein
MLVGIALTGCQTAGRTDSLGQDMQLSEWRDIPLDESDLDLPLLLPEGITVTRLEMQVRDNAITHNRYLLNNGRGLLFQTRVGSGFYHDSIRENFLSAEDFEMTIGELMKDRAANPVLPHPLIYQNWKIGYWTILDTGRGPCLFARAGNRLGNPLGYRNDRPDNWDTTLELMYCAVNVSIDMFSPAIGKADMVEDRQSYHMALVASGKMKPSAAKP